MRGRRWTVKRGKSDGADGPRTGGYPARDREPGRAGGGNPGREENKKGPKNEKSRPVRLPGGGDD